MSRNRELPGKIMNNPTRYLLYEEVSSLANFKISRRSERIKGLEIRNLVVKNFDKNGYFETKIVKPWKNRK